MGGSSGFLGVLRCTKLLLASEVGGPFSTQGIGNSNGSGALCHNLLLASSSQPFFYPCVVNMAEQVCHLIQHENGYG